MAGDGIRGYTDGTGSAARFITPYGVTTDGTNLYIADKGNMNIRKIVLATGEVSTLTGTFGYRYLYIATDGQKLYATAEGNHHIKLID